MNTITTSAPTVDAPESKEDRGFTLVEILIAIVLVGILSAVVVVGISNLTSKGSSSACAASLDAAKAGSVVYYASNGNTYPVDFEQLTESTKEAPAALTLPSGVSINEDKMSVSAGSNWTLTMSQSKDGAPLFACS